VEVLNGRMVTVAVGDVPQGGTETIQIVAQADPALADGTRLKNTASLLYAESVADQAAVTLVVGRGQAGVANPSTAQTPPAAAGKTPSPNPSPTLASGAATPTALPPSPSPTPAPAANKLPTPTPAGSLLPTTGQAASAVWPAALFVVALLALGVYSIRRRPSAE
jgi:LPXTG-motif cell wall-anchored protein